MTEAQYVQTCRAILNSGALTASSTPTSGDDAKWPDDQIERAVRAAVSKKIGEIASNPNDSRRASLLVTSDAMSSSPADLTTDLKVSTVVTRRIGPISGVRITDSGSSTTRAGIPDTPDAVERRRANVLSLAIPVFYYSLDGERLYFTATSCTVQFVPEPAGTSADAPKVQRPDEIDVICMAMAILFPFEGGRVQAAQHYKSVATDMRARVVQERGSDSKPNTPSFPVV